MTHDVTRSPGCLAAGVGGGLATVGEGKLSHILFPLYNTGHCISLSETTPPFHQSWGVHWASYPLGLNDSRKTLWPEACEFWDLEPSSVSLGILMDLPRVSVGTNARCWYLSFVSCCILQSPTPLPASGQPLPQVFRVTGHRQQCGFKGSTRKRSWRISKVLSSLGLEWQGRDVEQEGGVSDSGEGYY